MIPSHHILPSNAPPMDSDRVLRQTSGNANYITEDYNGNGDPEVNSSDDDDSAPESNSRAPVKSRRHRQAANRDGARAVRESHTERHARSNRLRALTQDPSSVFVAKYEDKFTSRKFQRRERIAEAILPDEKQQWQDHMLEEQAKEQQRKRAYLDRERKELVKTGNNAGQVVWSRVLDDAYQIAIRCVPPILGKKKMSIPDGHGGTKLAGRNELISRKIFQLTGQIRYRKQISSHNQVLRKFRVKNPHGFDVGTLEKGKDSRYVRIYDTKNLQWDDEKGQLIYVDPNPHASKSQSFASYNDRISMGAHGTFLNGQFNQSVCIQSVDFAMNQYAPESEDRYLAAPEHQYTTLQSTMGARPQPLEEVADWRRMFPPLAKLEKNSDLHNCDIILFDASLAIGQPPRGKSRLSIKFNLDLYCHPGFRNWHIRTTFCEENGKPRCAFTDNIDTTHRKDTTRTELVDVPFTSHWWRDLFSGIMKRRWEREQFDEKKIEEAGHGHCDGDCEMCAKLRQAARARLQEEDEYSNRYLQELSVMQELYATDRPAQCAVPGKAQQRVAVFLWRFRRAWPGEAASTIWRRLSHAQQPITDPTQLAHLTVPAMPAADSQQDKEYPDPSYLTSEAMQDPPSTAAAIPYDISAAATYWDSQGWPLTAAADGTEDASATCGASFSTCPAPSYAYMDPSPSTQHTNDSGYASQGGPTPLMQSTDGSHGGAMYMDGHDASSAPYGYEQLQHVSAHGMGLSSFGGINMYESHHHDSAAQPHAISHDDLASANLFSYAANGQMQLQFMPDQQSGASALSLGHDTSSVNATVGLGHEPANDPSALEGGDGNELHAPQPLHAHAQASGHMLESALHFANAGDLFSGGAHDALSTSNAEASMLLALAHSGADAHQMAAHDADAGSTSSSNGSPSSSRHPSIHSALSVPTSISSMHSGQLSTALWMQGHGSLQDLPAGLFMDLGSSSSQALAGTSTDTSTGPPASAATAAEAIHTFDAGHGASSSRSKVQETGRLLGALLGTGTDVHGLQTMDAGEGADEDDLGRSWRVAAPPGHGPSSVHGHDPHNHLRQMAQMGHVDFEQLGLEHLGVEHLGQMREYGQRQYLQQQHAQHGYDHGHAHGSGQEGEWRGRMGRMDLVDV